MFIHSSGENLPQLRSADGRGRSSPHRLNPAQPRPHASSAEGWSL